MTPNSRLEGAIVTLRSPASHESDDALLNRYVQADDQAAFAGLVRKHGGMVLAACRRQLRQQSDAEDAFQIVFMVLARDAKRIRNAGTLPSWLHRVACRASRKLAMRHRTLPPLEGEPPSRESTPLAEVQQRELAQAIDGGIDRLSSKYREVLLLCGLQGLTNTQAAERLNCPVGTIDSRLRDARRKLQTQLVKRGFLAGAVLGLLTPTLLNANALLVQRTIQQAWMYHRSPGSVTIPLFTIANGVNTMTALSSLKVLTATCLAVVMCGSVGLGIYANADDKPAVAEPEKKKEEAKPPQGKLTTTPKPSLSLQELMEKTAATRKALQEKYTVDKNMDYDLGTFLNMLEKQYGIKSTVDVAAIVNYVGLPGGGFDGTGSDDISQTLKTLYEKKVIIPRSRDMSVSLLLNSVLAQVNVARGLTYTLSQGEVLIIPKHQMRGMPPQVIAELHEKYSDDVLEEYYSGDLGIERSTFAKQVLGPVVHISAEDEPLTLLLKKLQLETGANIILDRRCIELAKETVSVSFNDVRIYTVLEILSDMYGLHLEYKENVYYITSP